MPKLRNFSIKKINFSFLVLLFLIPTLLDNYINSNRVHLWEPDDAEHYILKKTQLKRCFLNECEFNKSVENYINNRLLQDDRIIKRTVIDYHPIYSAALLILEKLSFDQYTSFSILNYLASFLMIYFSLKFYLNYFKENLLKSNALILYIIFFIFLTVTLTMWRDAFKLNFGILIYLLDKLINKSEEPKSFNFYFVNFIQIFIHPAGIICSLIIIFVQYLNLINFKIKNAFVFVNKSKDLLYFFITIILVVIYYFNGIKYVDLNINIANVYDGGTESIIRLNLLNLKNYVISLNGIVFLIAIFTLFKKITRQNKILFTIIIIIIAFHVLNPSPNKNIIRIFDFLLKFIASIFLFQIFLNYKKKIDLFFFSAILFLQFINFSKDIYNYLLVRPVIDNLNYSKNILDNKYFLKEKKKLIVIDGDNDLLLYNHLNNGLIDRSIYYTGYSSESLHNIVEKNHDFFLIFDLFNNSSDLIKKKKNTGRSFSKFLSEGDILKIQNKDSKNISLNLFTNSSGKILVNGQIKKFQKNEILNISIPANKNSKIEFLNVKNYIELVSLKKETNKNLNFPWEKPVTLEIYNKFLNESILIDFVNLKLSTKCEITKIYNDNYQDIYAKAVCK